MSILINILMNDFVAVPKVTRVPEQRLFFLLFSAGDSKDAQGRPLYVPTLKDIRTGLIHQVLVTLVCALVWAILKVSL